MRVNGQTTRRLMRQRMREETHIEQLSRLMRQWPPPLPEAVEIIQEYTRGRQHWRH